MNSTTYLLRYDIRLVLIKCVSVHMCASSSPGRRIGFLPPSREILKHMIHSRRKVGTRSDRVRDDPEIIENRPTAFAPEPICVNSKLMMLLMRTLGR
jgi:hypothetical protein